MSKLISKDKAKEKRMKGFQMFVLLSVVVCIFAILYNSDSPHTDVPIQNVDQSTKSLDQSYADHENYVWHVCKEGVKLLDSTADDFSGPTYAGEYMGELIVKGSSNRGNFMCVFVSSDNQRGLDLKDVQRQN